MRIIVNLLILFFEDHGIKPHFLYTCFYEMVETVRIGVHLVSKSILVVDDDTDLLYCYSIMLKKEGTKVITCNDVDEAQRIVRSHQIDLVILDYMMPKLRGDQLALKIHEINERVKIIFVSGYSEVIDAVKKLNIKIHGVFMKPVDPTIIEKIAAADIDSVENTILYEIPVLNVYSNF